MKSWRLSATLALALVIGSHSTAPAQAADAKPVVETYADIALAMYEDPLITAETLKAAVDALVAKPSRVNLIRARAAWIAARQPYQQSEGYRFGNAIVDDWEGKVNAWPLDEGLIDYVAASYGKQSDENPFFTANIIANKTLKLGGKTIDASKITPALLSGTLQEIDGVESNVATGYHAIEFLLWGQDLNGTGPGAGNRPHTDFDPANCTGGNCERRAQYLTAATELLISDLKDIVAAWAPGGAARKAVTADPAKGVAAMIKGIGSLSYGELAGERIKLGLMLHDPEEEHDCFSDNTQNSHYYDQLGMIAIYRGHYARIDGTLVKGPSLKDLVAAKAAGVAGKIDAALEATQARMQVMKDTADRRIMAYDQMIGSGNAAGNKIIQDVVDGLVAQAKAIELAMAPLGLSGIEFEGSDSLDDPSKVGK
jgi:putative iron-regulated protein